MQAALATLFDPVYIVDRDYNLLWVNNAFQTQFGYRPRKRLLCHQVTRMAICNTEECILKRCQSNRGAGHQVETVAAGAVEPNATCLAAGFPLHHPDSGEVVAAVGVLRDTSAEVRLHKRFTGMLEAERNRKEILEQMVAERTAELSSTVDTLNQANVDLTNSRREIADILENIRQGILTIDEKLQVGREYSRFSESVFGRADLGGLPFPELLSPSTDDLRERKELVEWLKLVFHSPTLDWKLAKSMSQSEYQLKRADGGVADLRVDFEPIRDEQRVKRIMVLIEDLTEQKKLERAIETKDREMAESLDHLAELAKLDPELYEALFDEAKEIIDRSTASLRMIREAADPTRVIDGMFRDMHTLKGNAMSFGMVRIAAKAHWVEDAFSGLRQSAANLGEAIIADTEEKVRELGELFQRLQKMASRVLQSGPKDSGEVRGDSGREMKLEIEQRAIDELIGWAEAQLGVDGPARELVTRIRSLSLVPISRVYHRFPKMVDDLADTLNKSVNPIELSGGEIGMEAKAFNQLANALVHLLRNAIDHGIEAPEVRIKNGKPAHGTISLRAYHDGDRLRLDLRDDGGGIDGERLVAIARAKGILAADEHPTGAAALQLIFRPGFSTAAKTTDVSGRGVGMDAVKSILVELGGEIDVETRVGVGTTFKLWLPTDVAMGLARPPKG